MKSILQVTISTAILGVVAASGFNSSCTTQCGSDCCSETEKCSYHPLYGNRCEETGKRVFCSDGLSYCIEPSTCCGLMSCCPSNTVCCGLNSCCAKEAVCCGMSTCCPKGSSCCGFSTCCSRGSRCVNGYCRAPWSSSMRWYYLLAVLIPFLFVMIYLAKRRQLRLAQQRGQVIRCNPVVRDGQVEGLNSPSANFGYDRAPVVFEPPPYSEIANMPSEVKPPSYNELFNVTQPESNIEQPESATGNQTAALGGGDGNAEAANQVSEETVNQSTTRTEESKP